jgi:hypothetical protein
MHFNAERSVSGEKGPSDGQSASAIPKPVHGGRERWFADPPLTVGG